MRSLRPVLVELGREKHACGLEDLVRAPQLVDLLAKVLDLLALSRGRQIRAQALLCLPLTHVLAQRLRRDAEIGGDVRDRSAGLKHQPGAAIKQLGWVLPRTGHRREAFLSPGTEPWNRGLRQTQPASDRDMSTARHPQPARGP